MGISLSNGALALLHDVIRSERLVVAGLRMAELGNQSVRKEVLGVQVPAKKLFAAMGFEHTSIDINGKDGALSIDLRAPIARPELLGAFDLVTNFGTIEHVAGQYEAWRNVHRLAKEGGLMLHLLPAAGSWPGHCDYRYDADFVPALAKLCGYEILRHSTREIDRDARFVVAALRRTAAEFPSEAAFRASVRIDGPG
jgi:SAM-dependent methyltransferase